MKSLKELDNLKRILEGPLKEAWDLLQEKNKEGEKETIISFNVTGCYTPNPYESAIISLLNIKAEIYSLCEREFKVSKILMDNEERREVYDY